MPSFDRATRRWDIDVSHVVPSATTSRGSLASRPSVSSIQRFISIRRVSAL
jgi:hypothetical protein